MHSRVPQPASLTATCITRTIKPPPQQTNYRAKTSLRKVDHMKSYGISLCALACFTALTLPCAAQDSNSSTNPWHGSWKMDPSSLKYDGPTVSITTDATGYTITRGGKADPKVVCDGKPNPPNDGATTTCTKTATGYALENTRADKTATPPSGRRPASRSRRTPASSPSRSTATASTLRNRITTSPSPASSMAHPPPSSARAPCPANSTTRTPSRSPTATTAKCNARTPSSSAPTAAPSPKPTSPAHP